MNIKFYQSNKTFSSSGKKTMLVLPEYFYPDVAAIPQLIYDVLVGIKDIFDITVVCKVPCSTGHVMSGYLSKKVIVENRLGIKVLMIPMKDYNKKSTIDRLASIASYFFAARKQIAKLGSFNVVFSVATPPLFGALLAIYAKRKTKGKLVYNIQDLHPEGLIATGFMKAGAIYKTVLYLEKKVCLLSDKVVLVGHNVQLRFLERFSHSAQPDSVVVNNWSDDEYLKPLSKTEPHVLSLAKRYGINNTFNIVYSGNIGGFYDLQNIVKTLVKIRDRTVRFVFIGDGVELNNIMKIVEENHSDNFVFIPYQSRDQLLYSLNLADVHLVLGQKGLSGISVPSKIYGIMSVNKPVFAVLEKKSDISELIKLSNCGVIYEPARYEDILNGMVDLLNNKEAFVSKYSNGRAYLDKYCSKKQSIEKYKNVFASVIFED